MEMKTSTFGFILGGVIALSVIITVFGSPLIPHQRGPSVQAAEPAHELSSTRMNQQVHRYSFDDGVDCYTSGYAMACLRREP